MRATKRRIEAFSFFNQRGICAHLSKMAEKGWMIDRLSNLSWVYRRTEPQRLHFAVSYDPKASAFDPESTEAQRVFQDFCAHTGWELACASAQLQIFYNQRENPTPIETEPTLELAGIHASAKKAFLPPYLLLLCIAILQGALFVSRLLGDPISLLSSPAQLFTGFCFLLLFLLTAVELSCYFRWYARAKKAAPRGEFLSPPDTSLFQKVILIAVLISGVYYALNLLLAGDPMRRWVMLLMCLYFPLLYALVNGTKAFLKRRNASRAVNRTLTIAMSVLLAFLMMGGIVFGTLRLSRDGFFAQKDEETYEHNGMTWVIHQDELPLTVEDLMDVEYAGYIRERRGEESILLGQFELHQRARYDAEDRQSIPSLEYEMVVVKLPGLYDLCKERLIHEREYWRSIQEYRYEATAAGPWGAQEAYQLADLTYGPREVYLLCYTDTLLEIQFDWEPTPEQKAIVGAKFA